ncbi:unnamed protein product [Ilex paraguariensis]|uniref:Uncharacterized protein n=1 Tax=Ilex paraguariensis TaxID=185542 RepID=A0ABC8T9S1_9AQUA
MNLLRTEGQAKVGGTLVCVIGAILIALFQGPTLFGYGEIDFAAQSQISARGPEPAGCTETVNLLRTEGQAKFGGTLVCVIGAILMALFQGPTLFGYGEIDFAAQSQISAREPEPAGWLLSSFLNFGIDLWHLGVLCLIGNCICMAAYIAIQGLKPALVPRICWSFGQAEVGTVVWDVLYSVLRKLTRIQQRLLT